MWNFCVWNMCLWIYKSFLCFFSMALCLVWFVWLVIFWSVCFYFILLQFILDACFILMCEEGRRGSGYMGKWKGYEGNWGRGICNKNKLKQQSWNYTGLWKSSEYMWWLLSMKFLWNSEQWDWECLCLFCLLLKSLSAYWIASSNLLMRVCA